MLTAAEVQAQLDAIVNGDAEVGSPGHRRRLQILSAARELFIAQGYKKTSVAEIARRAGVTKPTLYAHYPSKAKLLWHALADEKREYMSRLAALFDESLAPRERLRCLLEQSFLLVRDMPLTARLIDGEQDTLFALAELEDARAIGKTARAEALRTSIHEELLDHFARDVLTAAQRRERAKVLASLCFSLGRLADNPAVTAELSYERLSSVLATMLAAGVDTPDP